MALGAHSGIYSDIWSRTNHSAVEAYRQTSKKCVCTPPSPALSSNLLIRMQVCLAVTYSIRLPDKSRQGSLQTLKILPYNTCGTKKKLEVPTLTKMGAIK